MTCGAKGGTVQQDGIALHSQPSLAEPLHHQRVDAVLLDLHPGRHFLDIVTCEDGDASLQDHGTAIQLFGDEMDAGTVLAITGINLSLIHI